MIYPGPRRIAPDGCPGGVVVFVYTATDPPECLAIQPLRDEAAAEDAASIAASLHTGPVCLVAFDGDSGERMPAEAWL